MTEQTHDPVAERSAPSEERPAESGGWLHRVFVGRTMAPWRATFGLLFGPLLLTADAIVHQVRGEAAVRPAVVPLALGIMLVAASHLFAAEHTKPRVAARIVGNGLITAAIVLWVLDWPW